MDPRERIDILGQWGPGLVDGPQDRRARAVLDRDLEGSPVKGKPLRLRMRNWRPDAESYVASMGGPLPYMQRLKAIELLEEEHLHRLEALWRGLARRHDDPADFARRWRRVAERRNFYAINDLIAQHNRWYPAEARLPMDPATGDFVRINGRPYRRRPLDAAWVLERLPADRGAAVAAPAATTLCPR